ncbi:nitronate monooxygenase [Phenylobacterium sp. J367]|uniref:nitronate monooxygenase n=1 Tax=Phenylobacterium sp. J367 TaxID=2898435 RepID=UPI00215123A0|nr:nitronate monooxygenase [Phenylobacterium sp. J367]MCR5879869.1 nitronate monooxygenase [Phenylobacterium sp. J367]
MQTKMTSMFGIEYPIFAFSHCRDVVAAVSKAGGMGVFGVSALLPEDLETDLAWLDRELQGRPYGVDLVVPESEGKDLESLKAEIPEAHKRFVAQLGERFGVPERRSGRAGREFGKGTWGPKLAAEQWQVALNHKVAAVVSALGPLPPSIVEAARANNIRVGGMSGAPEHARRHVAGGAEFVIAQGTEAGGHTGDVSTFVLVPQVVDAVGPVPVLAAGGVGTGRQLAAALALGAEGVWTGSIWLTSNESSLHPRAVEKLLAASSFDTVRSRARTGKPLRQLKTAWNQAWEAEGAPKPLPAPYQRALVYEQMQSIEEHGVAEPIGSAVGQIVGTMNERRPAARIMRRLVEEYAEVADQLRATINTHLGD